MSSTSLSFQLAAYGLDLNRTLPTVLATLRAVGFDHAVIPPALLSSHHPAELSRQFAAAGMDPVVMFSQTPQANVSADSRAVRAAGRDRLLALVDAAHEMGARRITGLAYGVIGEKHVLPGSERWHTAAGLVAQAADHAAQAGITPSVEVLNRYETSMLNTAGQAVEFIRAGGSESLTIHLDTFHMVIDEPDPVAAIEHAGDRLGYLELGQTARGLLSAGQLDLAPVLRGWRRSGVDCLLGVEAFTRANLSDQAAETLSIWQTPFQDGSAVAEDAARYIGSTLD